MKRIKVIQVDTRAVGTHSLRAILGRKDGDGSWSIRIDGDPCIETRIDASTSNDAKQPDVLMTAVHAVNAIPSVVAGPVGVLTHLDLPLFSGTFSA